MSVNLIGSDIKIMRDRYDEALQMQGIPCKYQYPNIAESSKRGQPIIDTYSDMVDTHIFFDGNPKIKTFKRYGWVVENDENLPFLIHCSFNLEKLQKDCIFRISGQYTEMPDRIFRVTELTCDIQAPDHMIAQVVPVYGNDVVGKTSVEIKNTYNKSNHFLKPTTDYRGNYISEQEGES